jgi:presenilin 1
MKRSSDRAPTMMDPANDDGNCLPDHHDDAVRGGLQSVDVDEVDDDDGGNNDEGEGEKDVALSLNELMYSAHSFHVISLPVSLTMTLAALAVTYVNTPETIQQGAAMMSQAYHVWKVDSDIDSTSRQLVLDFANGLVIVTVIGTMTFGIVLLYKYRCMKVLVGYMMFSSMTLLGVLGAELANVAIEKYRVPIDWFTFVFGIYNFAVVGVTSIFYGAGIPSYVTQGYLICSSVIISWQLSHFDAMSTWTLLIMLGLYDLCAVLAPCGPLRALVNLMSDEDSPEMPGLL